MVMSFTFLLWWISFAIHTSVKVTVTRMATSTAAAINVTGLEGAGSTYECLVPSGPKYVQGS